MLAEILRYVNSVTITTRSHEDQDPEGPIDYIVTISGGRLGTHDMALVGPDLPLLISNTDLILRSMFEAVELVVLPKED